MRLLTLKFKVRKDLLCVGNAPDYKSEVSDQIFIFSLIQLSVTSMHCFIDLTIIRAELCTSAILCKYLDHSEEEGPYLIVSDRKEVWFYKKFILHCCVQYWYLGSSDILFFLVD